MKVVICFDLSTMPFKGSNTLLSLSVPQLNNAVHSSCGQERPIKSCTVQCSHIAHVPSEVPRHLQAAMPSSAVVVSSYKQCYNCSYALYIYIYVVVYGCTLPADKSYSLTAPPLLPLNSNSSHGSKHTLSIAVLLPVKLQMWLARPSFQTLTRLSSPPVASTAPECGPIATQLTFVE
jgi:hypothetical protein